MKLATENGCCHRNVMRVFVYLMLRTLRMLEYYFYVVTGNNLTDYHDFFQNFGVIQYNGQTKVVDATI